MAEHVKATVRYVIQRKFFPDDDWIDMVNLVYENKDKAIAKIAWLYEKQYAEKDNTRIVQRITTEVVV